MICLVVAGAILGGCASAAPTPRSAAATDSLAANQPDPHLDRVAELYRLYAYWKSHCDQAFVTPEVMRRYEAAVLQMEQAGYGYGRNSNFAGVKPPRAAWVECAENGG